MGDNPNGHLSRRCGSNIRLPVKVTAMTCLCAVAVTALASTSEAQQGEPGSGMAQLPHDLSPWGMFCPPTSIVQSVMVGLFIASIVTWTVALPKASS